MKHWDAVYDPGDDTAPLFEAWWNGVKELGRDTERLHHIRMPNPKDYVLLSLIDSVPDHPYFDLDSTEVKETAIDVLAMAFTEGVKRIDSLQSHTGKSITWANYKGTHLSHWLNAIKPFNIYGLPIGGNEHIVNATTSDHGPSWRMIVSLEEPVRAWGVYPGGESGNPGSPYYDQFVMKWAEGKYYELLYLQSPGDTSNRIVFNQTLQP